MLPSSVLGALDGRLGPHLGPLMLICAQNEPQNGPQNHSENYIKIGSKNDPGFDMFLKIV